MNPKPRDPLWQTNDCRELLLGVLLAVAVLGVGVVLGNWHEQTKELTRAAESMEQHRELLRALDSMRDDNQRVLMQNRAALEALTQRH